MFNSFAYCLNLTRELRRENSLWQYRLWSFQGRDTKLERFLAKNQLYSNEITKFENWSNGEQTKIGHQKMSITKNVLFK